MTQVCDFHTHIGQWFTAYYSANAVFTALKAAGVDECWFSSTSSERWCKESFAVRGDAKAQEPLPTAAELYTQIRDEVKDALAVAKRLGLAAHPLYWVIPEVHFSGAASVAQAMRDLSEYEGFKLHPRGNHWDLTDGRTAALAEEVFSYAETHGLLILIHCGDDDFEKPALFEPFIARHPSVTVQLAHTRPLDQTLSLLRAYPNTLCDTAFASDEVQQAVCNAGFASRMRYGSDFPITHWYAATPDHDPTAEELTAFLKGEQNRKEAK